MKAPQRTLVDLFAGAGGLSCGLHMAGFRPVLANELVPEYASTYAANNPNTRLIVADIRSLLDSDVRRQSGLAPRELDLLAGGPPCQGFSVNAPIRSLDDQRNHLFRDFLRIAEALQPKAILIENVPGMVSLARGTVVEQIKKELAQLGYRVGVRILFAGHYGVPQLRFRTIIIGLRGRGREVSFPEPKFNARGVANFAGGKSLTMPILELERHLLQPHTTVWDAISDLPPIEHEERAHSETARYATKPVGWYQSLLRAGSRKVNNHHCAGLSQINMERLKHIPPGGSWRDIPLDLLPAGLRRARRSDHTKRYGRLHKTGLCSTILTKCDPHWGSFFHPEQDRVLSVREAARIQSFPDTFTFTGSLSDQYAQVGNAVPPLLSKAVGDCIAAELAGAENTK